MFPQGSLDKTPTDLPFDSPGRGGNRFAGLAPLNDETQHKLKIQLAVHKFNNSSPSSSPVLSPIDRRHSINQYRFSLFRTTPKRNVDEQDSPSKKTMDPSTLYQGVGNFPTVRLNKSAVLIRHVKRNASRDIRVPLPEIPHNRFLCHIADNSSELKPSTRSVLDVLQDMSRKRIHSKDDSEENGRKRFKGLGGGGLLDPDAPYQPLFVPKGNPHTSNGTPTINKTTQTVESPAMSSPVTPIGFSMDDTDPRTELRRQLAKKNNEISASLSSSMEVLRSLKRERNSFGSPKHLDPEDARGCKRKLKKTSNGKCSPVVSDPVRTMDLSGVIHTQKIKQSPKVSPQQDRLMTIFLEMKDTPSKAQVFTAKREETRKNESETVAKVVEEEAELPKETSIEVAEVLETSSPAAVGVSPAAAPAQSEAILQQPPCILQVKDTTATTPIVTSPCIAVNGENQQPQQEKTIGFATANQKMAEIPKPALENKPFAFGLNTVPTVTASSPPAGGVELSMLAKPALDTTPAPTFNLNSPLKPAVETSQLSSFGGFKFGTAVSADTVTQNQTTVAPQLPVGQTEPFKLSPNKLFSFGGTTTSADVQNIGSSPSYAPATTKSSASTLVSFPPATTNMLGGPVTSWATANSIMGSATSSFRPATTNLLATTTNSITPTTTNFGPMTNVVEATKSNFAPAATTSFAPMTNTTNFAPSTNLSIGTTMAFPSANPLGASFTSLAPSTSNTIGATASSFPSAVKSTSTVASVRKPFAFGQSTLTEKTSDASKPVFTFGQSSASTSGAPLPTSNASIFGVTTTAAMSFSTTTTSTSSGTLPTPTFGQTIGSTPLFAPNKTTQPPVTSTFTFGQTSSASGPGQSFAFNQSMAGSSLFAPKSTSAETQNAPSLFPVAPTPQSQPTKQAVFGQAEAPTSLFTMNPAGQNPPFGQSASQGPQSTFAFGQNMNKPLAFGQTSGSSFFNQAPVSSGQTASAQAPAFGQSLGFGQPSSFGQAQTDSKTSFGQAPAAPASSFGSVFATPTSTPSTQSTFAFGGAAPNTSTGFPSAPATTASSVFTFGAAAPQTAFSPAQPQPQTGSNFSFNSTSNSSSTPFSFGNRSSEPFKFGSASGSSGSGMFNFGAGSSATTQPAPPAFNFGATQANQQPAPPAFGFGGSSASSTSGSTFTFGATPSPGAFGTPTPTPSPSFPGMFNIGSGSAPSSRPRQGSRMRRRP